MSIYSKSIHCLIFAILLPLITINLAVAAPFEIKVHDELIAEFEHSAYEIETNTYKPTTAQGLKHNIVQTRLEYGYGLTSKSEVGVNLYLSNYNGTSYINGGKISHMYIPTHDEDGPWHYGVKNEINYIKDIIGTQTTFYELTPIIALQIDDWRFTINPSVDITLTKKSSITLSPSAKAAYKISNNVDLGMEYYADNLSFKHLYNMSNQPNTAYLVFDVKHGKSSLNFGLGKGVNSASDKWVAKFIAALNFD